MMAVVVTCRVIVVVVVVVVGYFLVVFVGRPQVWQRRWFVQRRFSAHNLLIVCVVSQIAMSSITTLYDIYRCLVGKVQLKGGRGFFHETKEFWTRYGGIQDGSVGQGKLRGTSLVCALSWSHPIIIIIAIMNVVVGFFQTSLG